MATPTSKPEDGAAVRDCALGLLARREHTVLELRHKLLRRGFAADRVEAVLASLVAQDALSDARFADLYAHSRVDKGYGPLRIQMELRERGVDAATIAAVLDGLADFWTSKILQVHHKKFAGALPRDPAGRARQTRFLRQRGFTLEQIDRLFRRS
ncbi:MAG: recombination regulator RecX [Pseudomonadota bacterium]|nr:recombination regulator RecX [Pseudomonadota bacterium]